MTLQALNAALDRGLTQAADHGMLAGLVDAVAVNAADPELRWRCRVLADDGGAGDPLVYNVLCAGLFGVLPGGPGLRPAAAPGEYLYRVNVFLHGMRKAILACRALEETRQSTARSYIFYPEFLFIANLRQRVAALARAHAGMGPRNDELSVLHALAGHFGLSDAGRAARVVGSRGSSSVMTAHALYQAAGCAMIGARPSPMDAPTDASEAPGAAACNDNETGSPPPLDVGDIYIVDGSGEHLRRTRGVGAPAEHVGIVVEKYGEREFRTVDGGFGIGADVSLSRKREMVFRAGVGWTFADAPLAVSAAEAGRIERQMQPYAQDAAMERTIDTDDSFAELRPGLARTRRNIEAAADHKLREMHAKTLAMILANARLMQRRKLASDAGAVRTIQGWWGPARRADLQPANPDAIHRLLSA